MRGLKLVLFISVPASAGLVVLARPLTILLFQHGTFDDEAVRQTTDMVRMFGCAVWAYSPCSSSIAGSSPSVTAVLRC